MSMMQCRHHFNLAKTAKMRLRVTWRERVFLSHTEVQRATHIALPIVGLFLTAVACAVVGGGREGDRTADAAREILVVALTVHATPLGRAVTLVVTCKWGQ